MDRDKDVETGTDEQEHRTGRGTRTNTERQSDRGTRTDMGTGTDGLEEGKGQRNRDSNRDRVAQGEMDSDKNSDRVLGKET